MAGRLRTSARPVACCAGALALLLAGCSAEAREASPAPAAAASWQLDVLALIDANWRAEAAQRCREQIAAEPNAPMPRALMALATWWEPNRAARCCWEAVARRGHGTAHEQRIVDALQDYFWVKSQPELVDERYGEVPQPGRAADLAQQLAALATDAELQLDETERAVTSALHNWAKLQSGPQRPPADLSVDELRSMLRHYNSYLERTGAVPFEVSGYQRAVQVLLAKEQDPAVHAYDWELPGFDYEPRLARVPRHPDLSWGGLARPLPGLTELGPEQGQPERAASFELPAGVGGTRAFSPGDGEPKLVVFFLGFGCAHCVAQLKDLDPKAAAFRDAGIEVLSIGTDSYEEVLAAQQASIENGVDPLHFDVLCDPDGEVFKQWRVWDDLEDEALHGTFLVDGQGRVLWRDISERPFEESEWLLAECRRLLAAWK